MPTSMRIGSDAVQVLWAIFALFGVVLISSGFFYSLGGLTNFGIISLSNSAALSNISGGIVIFVVGLVVTGASYRGIRRRRIITITISEETKTQP